MTDEQKFLFDLKGWLLLPGVLVEPEVAAIREHVAGRRTAIPAPRRNCWTIRPSWRSLNDILSERPPAEDYTISAARARS